MIVRIQEVLCLTAGCAALSMVPVLHGSQQQNMPCILLMMDVNEIHSPKSQMTSNF